MKKSAILTLAVILSVVILAACAPDPEARAWRKDYKKLEASITVPSFRAEDYRIDEFLAEPNDPQYLNHDVINRAIETCHMEGGGRVVVPPGVWYTGPIELKSNVNLHLEEGAVLHFIYKDEFRLDDKAEAISMIRAFEIENIAITGKGSIDGGDIKKSVPGKSDFFIAMGWCNNILIQDITIKHIAYCAFSIYECSGLTMKNVRTVDDSKKLQAGLSVMSSVNVLIDGCELYGTDTPVYLSESGAKNPSGSIIVRNCRLLSGDLGSIFIDGSSGIFVENCSVSGDGVDIALNITTLDEEMPVRNIFIRNVTVDKSSYRVLSISNTDGAPIENVYLRGVKCGGSEYGAYIKAAKNGPAVNNVVISDCKWDNVEKGNVITGQVENITFDNVRINGQRVDSPTSESVKND